MGIFATGTVVLVRFPFSDLSGSKFRPAIVLANVHYGDTVLCQITSKRYADPSAVEIRADAFANGGLRAVSFGRPGMLFTAHASLITRDVGTLTEAMKKTVIEAVVGVLRPS